MPGQLEFDADAKSTIVRTGAFPVPDQDVAGMTAPLCDT